LLYFESSKPVDVRQSALENVWEVLDESGVTHLAVMETSQSMSSACAACTLSKVKPAGRFGLNSSQTRIPLLPLTELIGHLPDHD